MVREPGGDVVVVDACTSSGTNLTAGLLADLGAARIALLVLSHPDTDHVRGASAIVRSFDPHTIWTYPLAVSLRTHLSRMAAEDPTFTATGLPDLRAFIEALEPYRERNVAEDVQSNTASWQSPSGDLEVFALAPSQRDIDQAAEAIRRILRDRSGRLAASRGVEDFLRGRTAKVGDHPNLLSVGMSLRWRGRSLVLGGDVERGMTEHSGWRGALAGLPRTGRLARIQGASVVKVAHHGSDNAYCHDAWKEHARSVSELVALVCPFNRSGELPAHKALSDIRPHATRLSIEHHPDHALARRPGVESRLAGQPVLDAPPRVDTPRRRRGGARRRAPGGPRRGRRGRLGRVRFCQSATGRFRWA